MFSFIKISFIYAHFWKKNMHKLILFASSFQRMKYLKSSLPKGSLLDTTISLISISFVKIGLLC